MMHERPKVGQSASGIRPGRPTSGGNCTVSPEGTAPGPLPDAPQPRSPEPGEFPALYKLLDETFRAGGGSMARDYPRLLAEPNRFNLRVIVEGGRVLSHAGIVIREASLEGLTVRVALLGAVATAASSRGKGLATLCVTAAMQRAVELGADLMWISGTRGLYARLGARPVGDDQEFNLSVEDVRRFARDDAELKPLAEDDIPEAAELYAHEPVRFIRPLEDWQSAFRLRFAMDRPSRFLGAKEFGSLAAYAVLHEPTAEGRSFVAEYAGARGVLLGALPRMMREMGAKSLQLHLAHHDKTLARRLAAAGLKGTSVPAAGAALVLRFVPLMEKLRARFIERAGEGAGRELSFEEEGPPLGPGNLFRIACGPDVLRVDGRGALAELLFGSALKPQAAEGRGPTGSGLQDSQPRIHGWGAKGPFRAALPVPALWYGLNFV